MALDNFDKYVHEIVISIQIKENVLRKMFAPQISVDLAQIVGVTKYIGVAASLLTIFQAFLFANETVLISAMSSVQIYIPILST